MSGPAHDPGQTEAIFTRALSLQQARRYAEAAALFRAIAGPPLMIKVAVGLGACLLELGEFVEAERWLTPARNHLPDDPELRRLMGNLFSEMGRVDDAEREFRAGLATSPGHLRLQVALAGLLLSVGRYREGWALLEARIALHPDVVPPVSVSFPEWKGEPLEGRSILVWYEQGLGDQIQMSRFAQSLKAGGAGHVALGCRPPLAPLLAHAAGVDEVVTVPRGEAVSIKRYDLWSRYFSLPHRLGTELQDLPTRPYLSAPPDRRARWKGFSGVGLVWRASSTGFNAGNKNVPDEQAQRLLDAGAVSLHPEDTGVADFADTAAIVEQLDLVISIDTSVAHLAGAMGKPCWTLLPRVQSDWRWMRDREDSPWYPTLRLYRQQTARDWAPVIDRVLADLAAFRG